MTTKLEIFFSILSLAYVYWLWLDASVYFPQLIFIFCQEF